MMTIAMIAACASSALPRAMEPSSPPAPPRGQRPRRQRRQQQQQHTLLASVVGMGLLVASSSAFLFPGHPTVPQQSTPLLRRPLAPPPTAARPSPSSSSSALWGATTTTTTEAAAVAAAASVGKREQLLGAAKFKRVNPKSDRFQVLGFHHIEFYCGDATNTYRRWQLGLGMQLVCKSDLATGNARFASYCLQSGSLRFVFTAPYASPADVPPAPALEGEAGPPPEAAVTPAKAPGAGTGQQQEQQPCGIHPGFDGAHAAFFFRRHGVAARAIGIEVTDAAAAFEACVANGGQPALAPTTLQGPDGGQQGGHAVVAEVRAYGDVVLRFVSRHGGFDGAFLPGYRALPTPPEGPLTYGLERLDHAVGNVWDLLKAVNYVGRMTGFHEFAEFTAEDVGTTDSGLNSIVLASNDERVLLPLNEPTYGTPRKSQIQTYLEQNLGPGLQHLALATPDIFATMRRMRAATAVGGFEFQDPPNKAYYEALPGRIGGALTPEQYRMVEELGLLVDKDDQGVLLQVFTKPVGDRPTLFLEIIQRVGCQEPDPEDPSKTVQRGGCGGFGKGNFKALFESIERYERDMKLA